VEFDFKTATDKNRYTREYAAYVSILMRKKSMQFQQLAHVNEKLKAFSATLL